MRFAVLFGLFFSVFFVEVRLVQAATQFDQSVRIFEVRKSIPLSSFEKPQRDYYLNGGVQRGIKKGYVFKVYRKTSVFDPFYNKLSQDLKIEVAQLKVIHSDLKVAVARMFDVQDDEETVSLDYYAPMVGDQVDLQSGFRPGKKGAGGKGDLKFLDESYHQKIKQARQMKEKMEEENWEQTWNPPPPSSPEAASETSTENQNEMAQTPEPRQEVAQKQDPATEAAQGVISPKEEAQKEESKAPVAQAAEAPQTVPDSHAIELKAGHQTDAQSEEKQQAAVKDSKGEDVSVQVR